MGRRRKYGWGGLESMIVVRNGDYFRNGVTFTNRGLSFALCPLGTQPVVVAMHAPVTLGQFDRIIGCLKTPREAPWRSPGHAPRG
jgi:hypothetical protein